jgi:hypothetical protein
MICGLMRAADNAPRITKRMVSETTTSLQCNPVKACATTASRCDGVAIATSVRNDAKHAEITS